MCFEDELRHEDNMDGGRAYSAFTSSQNPIGWWSAAATCLSSSSFSWHSQYEKVFVRGKLSLALEMWLSRLENSLLELGTATGTLDHSNLSWATWNPGKRKKGREKWKKNQEKLISCWPSLACWQKVWELAASLGHTVTTCLENHKKIKINKNKEPSLWGTLEQKAVAKFIWV